MSLLTVMGITATIGQIALTGAFIGGAPAKVSVVGLSQIVFTLVLDVLVWQRSINGLTILGMVLVVAPSAWLMTHRTAPEVPLASPDGLEAE